jgi:TPR repeat protein
MCCLSRVLLSLLWALLVGVAGTEAAYACPSGSSPAEHIRCLCEKADRGDTPSQYLLGSAYFVGIETPQNYKEAAKWYRRAADQGDTEAQFRLGSMYYFGQGVAKSIVLAEMWFILSAGQGHDFARQVRDTAALEMTSAELAKAQKLAREWNPASDRFPPTNRCGSSS